MAPKRSRRREASLDLDGPSSRETASETLNLRVTPRLKALVSERADEAGMRVTDFVTATLDAAVEPYSPWGSFPTRYERRVCVGNEIFTRGEQLLQKMPAESPLASAEQPEQQPAPEMILRMTVPHGLNVQGTELDVYNEWDGLLKSVETALKEKSIFVQRLYIFDLDGRSPENITTFLKSFKKCKEAEDRLLEASRSRHLHHKRVEIRCTTVRNVMGAPGLHSDREYLNDVNIYGTSAVSFAVDTSYGVILKSMVSSDPRDITHWTNRFTMLWKDAFLLQDILPASEDT